jgi:hypothetical protein
MKEIPLTKGYVALIDDEDLDRVSRYKWYAHTTKSGVYAVTRVKIEGEWIDLKLHRLIMRAPYGEHVDHADGDTLNNQKSNLRFCTMAQNQYNQRPGLRGSLPYKGVNFHKRVGKYVARIGVGNRRISLGVYDTAEEAAAAYNSAARAFHGEFARLNPVDIEKPLFLLSEGRRCLFCGKTFVGKRLHRRFCSPNCARWHRTEKARNHNGH